MILSPFHHLHAALKQKNRLKANFCFETGVNTNSALAVPLKLRIEIRHLFEVNQLLCTDAAYAENVYGKIPFGFSARK